MGLDFVQPGSVGHHLHLPYQRGLLNGKGETQLYVYIYIYIYCPAFSSVIDTRACIQFYVARLSPQ